MFTKEIVFTGMGVLSPVGCDLGTFWNSLMENRSGVGYVNSLDVFHTKRPLGAEIPDFKPKEYFRSKKDVKQIKVMSRDIQLAFASAMLACSDAGLITEGENRNVDPDRFGVLYGADLIGLELSELLDAFKVGIKDGKHDFQTWGTAAMDKVFPLWMLKYLPNMPGCHIAIAHDARGPNNSLTMQRGSSLAAIIEAARIIEQGRADVMICGGCGNGVNPSFLARAKTHKLVDGDQDPTRVPRPFDADRCGSVFGEGAGAFILESRSFAEARGANILATLRGFGCGIEPGSNAHSESNAGVRRVIRKALSDAAISANELDHLCAEGLGTSLEDRVEASGIQAELGDVPVTALKGYFGNIGSGAGAVELAATLLALHNGKVPAARNCDSVASDCPVQVIRKTHKTVSKPFAMKLSNSIGGRSFAVIVEKAS